MSKNKFKKYDPEFQKMVRFLERQKLPITEMTSLKEKSNLAEWLESRLHMNLTMIADDMFGNGNVTRIERKVLSGAIGAALDNYHQFLVENAPQLFDRRPWDEAPGEDASPVSEAAKGEGDRGEVIEITESGPQGMFVPLVEKAVRRDGTIGIKIIQPGWGSSGYYPAEVLERDGAKTFPKGTKMFWNHQTAQEEAERPEGDLNDLAAELVTDPRYQANGVEGPGLYADAKVFEAYKASVEDLAAHIGTSIRATGRAQHGEIKGREGPIITELTKGKSVDFVTAAGAGGQILSLFEAARPHPQPLPIGVPMERGVEAPDKKTTSGNVENQSKLKETSMDELEFQKLQESVTTLQTTVGTVTSENAQLKERLALRDARDMVSKALSGLDLPEATKARLVKSLPKVAPLKEGALDEAAFKPMIEKAIKDEVEYLTKAAGLGKIRGLGESSNDEEEDATKVEESLVESFADLGLSEDGAKIAARGRG